LVAASASEAIAIGAVASRTRPGNVVLYASASGRPRTPRPSQVGRPNRGHAGPNIARSPEGRAYYDRKRAEGRSKQDALRCLKRRISDRVFQTLRRQPPAVALT
jgi:hypothetical protein